MAALSELRAQLVAALATLDGLMAAKAPAPPPAIAPLAWGAKVSAAFRDRVRWLADDLGMSPNHVMAVMAFETGRRFTPDVKNPNSSATGLIQFMNATATSLGTTTAELAAMTAEDQLNYVWKYFSRTIKARGPLRSLGDVYAAVLNPVGIGKPDDFPYWVTGSSAYAVNAGLDADKNHTITKGEATAKVTALMSEGMSPQNLG